MFVYLCIIICSAWLLSICFSSPLVVPTPVAAAESIHRSIPQPKLHLGEKKQHQHFAWLGRARSSSWCHHWNCRADAQEVFCTLSKAQGLRTARCSRSGMGWAGLDQPCVYSQLWINLSSSMFLLIPAGSHCFSNTCFLFFFSPSTPSSCVI